MDPSPLRGRFSWICPSRVRVVNRSRAFTVDKGKPDLIFGRMPNYTNSVWSEAVPAPPHPPLSGSVSVDVAVVGGGLTGITAALFLQRAGRRTAVVEARRIGKGETGKTTAHLTEALDVRYHTLVSRFGWAGAQLAAAGTARGHRPHRCASSRSTTSRAICGAFPDSSTPNAATR